MRMEQEFLDYLFEFVSENRQARFREIVEHRTRYATVVLEDIYQPHNASAVLRSCDCFGIQDVHIIENRNSWEYSPDVEKGSSKWLSIHRYHEKEQNSMDCIAHLRKQGYKIAATTPHTEMAIEQLPLDEPVALVLGTELTGVSDQILDEADYKVRIPMYGFTESFNISVAAAICMNDLRRRIMNSEIDWQLSENEKTDILIQWCKKTLKHFDNYEESFAQLKKG